MARVSRSFSIVVCIFAATVVLGAAELAVPAVSVAALNDCSQPVTNGLKPTASDCLFILKAALGSEQCNPECICAPKGTVPITAVDALVCLKVAVGQVVPLNCPCVPDSTTTTVTGPTTTNTTSTTITPPTTLPSSTSTSTSNTTSTTIVVVTTSTTNTTNTTTTTIGPCSIQSAICTEDACSCGQDPGIDYHVANSSGSVTGPVGTRFDVNINAFSGGQIDCGGWTRIDNSVQAGCNIIGCCRHDAGQADTVTWTVFEVLDLPCTCPNNPDAANLKHNLLLQCIFPGGAFVEKEQTSSGCS